MAPVNMRCDCSPWTDCAGFSPRWTATRYAPIFTARASPATQGFRLQASGSLVESGDQLLHGPKEIAVSCSKEVVIFGVHHAQPMRQADPIAGLRRSRAEPAGFAGCAASREGIGTLPGFPSQRAQRHGQEMDLEQRTG